MIKYDLACTSGHDFDAWFKSGASFDTQASAGQLECPVCGSHDVAKRPMAPAIKTSRSRSADATPHASGTDIDAGRNATIAARDLSDEFRAALKAFKAEVIANTEDVGQQFAEEARRMHYGEEPARPIRGAATAKEAVELHEEGIAFGILPPIADDKN